jgi:hypothetical protein
MADEDEHEVVSIDPEVREVLREFSDVPIALASEIVRLRAELDSARWERPRTEITGSPQQPPPDAPAPARLRG